MAEAVDSGRLAERTATVARRAQPPLIRAGGALRFAAPALLGYSAVRTFGVLLMWLHVRRSPLPRLSTLWDAVYYLGIADHGYVDDLGIGGYANGVPYSSRAFFPLYPGLIRAVHTVLPLTTAQAALLVAWAAALLAAAGIFAVAAHLYGRSAGVIAAVLWGVIPHAAVENYAYSESLFTALAAWALYAAVSKRWVWAGVVSTLSCLVRPTGIAVAAAVSLAAAWEVVQVLRRGGAAGQGDQGDQVGRGDPGRGVRWWRPLLGGFLAPLGWLGYVGYVGWARHEWDGYFRVQSSWGSQFDGGVTTYRWIRDFFLGQSGNSTTLDQVVMLGVVAAAVVLFVVSLAQRQPLPLIVFSVMMLLISLGNGAEYAPRARFLVPAFALLLPLAVGLARLRSRWSRWAILAVATLASGSYGVFLTFVDRFSP